MREGRRHPPVTPLLAAVLCCVLAAACGTSGATRDQSRPGASPARHVADDPGHPQHATAPSPRAGGVRSAAPAEPRTTSPRRFWVRDRHRYRSPWFTGAHRRMVGYGCTRAPYYAPDPRCAGGRGFHHGLDVAMPCGTLLRSGVRGRVVDPRSAGAPGPAYGQNAFRIRSHGHRVDVLLGHTRPALVRPGQRVVRGQPLARSSDKGAPDGCHLHFEVRPRRGTLTQAVNPRSVLRLHRVPGPEGAGRARGR